MKSVNIHEAKANLSQLVTRAAKGEPFVIAKAGKPLVKVVALGDPSPGVRRLGFLSACLKVPDYFNRMGEEEVRRQFARTNHRRGAQAVDEQLS